MLWIRSNRDRKYLLAAGGCMLMLIAAGCGDTAPEKPDRETVQADDSAVSVDENEAVDAETIAEVLRDLYDEAADENTLGSLAVMRRMMARLGGQGYTAVDLENQIDMTRAERAVAFCKAVEQKQKDEMTIIVLTGMGFHKYDLKTGDGRVNVLREYYQYNTDGHVQKKNEAGYEADLWQYTEGGYLFFQGRYFSDEDLVLTASDASEQVALRVLPLDEACRELNRNYIRPVGYGRNNIFLADWSEEDFGSLDFYDVFDHFYPILYGCSSPYTAVGMAESEPLYEIPETIFEDVVTAYFRADRETLRAKTAYLSESAAYQYRPRGFYEAEYPEIPYPEVVSYTENADGTITLFVNAVYPKESTAKAFSHKTIVRPLDGGGFQYVSNQILPPEDAYDAWWHTDRLTEEEKDLLTEAEKEKMQEAALTAAKQVREVYKDIEVAGEVAYGSNIKEFTGEQCREVVSLLGRAGHVSVTDDTNMENYEKIEAFYAAYRERHDAMETLYNVDRDGLIGAITFIYRDGRLQSYYVGIDWLEGGVPEIKSTMVSDIAEMKLTEKGYLLYAHEMVMPHSSLRQCWRIKPLSDRCRELTAKYVYGLSYVNYNVLVTNWDSNNVETILMPCMFEDIYRIAMGENVKPQKGKIPAETYERIMTTYFPVSVEQLREKCGYDEDSNSYAYEMIFSREYPPFGEVVDYTENDDGTITLTVDAVWADYNSDLAFTNRIVVQPFQDGSFRYLSNSVEEKEMEVPKVVVP